MPEIFQGKLFLTLGQQVDQVFWFLRLFIEMIFLKHKHNFNWEGGSKFAAALQVGNSEKGACRQVITALLVISMSLVLASSSSSSLNALHPFYFKTSDYSQS